MCVCVSPCCHSVYWPHSPFSLRFSSSGTNDLVLWSITARASSLIVFQFLSSVCGQTAAALKRLTDRKPASRRLSGSSHLHQVDVARLFGRPPRLSLQSVHVVQRPLPHRGEVAMLVTQLIPVVGLERQTGRETEIFYCHFS